MVLIYLSKDMNVDLSVFNIKGQRVKTVTAGKLTAGKHIFGWNSSNEQNQPVAAGIYFYRLESDIEMINKKSMIITYYNKYGITDGTGKRVYGIC